MDSDISDDEIGEGRQNGSSSSRESSPEPAQKRSFTPTSDEDHEPIVPSSANDDTPPPPDRPILRQPIWNQASASGSTSSLKIDTYVAKVDKPTTTTAFLPGQEVVAPLKKKRAKKQMRDTPGITRFRLDGYDHTPSASAPIRTGTGPYSSLYRATQMAEPSSSVLPRKNVPPNSIPILGGVPLQTLSTQASSSNGSTSLLYPATVNGSPQAPPSTSSSTGSPSGASPLLQGTNGLSTHRPRNANAAANSTINIPSSTEGASSQMPSKANITGALPRALSGTSTANPSPHLNTCDPLNAIRRSGKEPAPPATVPSNPVPQKPTATYRILNPGPAQPPVNPTYYRRNYETGRYIQDSGAPGPSRRPAEVQGRPNGDHLDRRQNTRDDLLTLLIIDVRSGEKDKQLAEVNVPLASYDGRRYWANAQDISEALQSSPSRIDGPAKVYTMRDGFKQFFLRVSADNVDTTTPAAHILVDSERTVKIGVENTVPVGAPIPRIPAEFVSRSPSPDSEGYMTKVINRALREVGHKAAIERERAYHRKRARSPYYDQCSSHDEDDHPESPLRATSSTTKSITPLDHHRSGPGPARQRRRTISPMSERRYSPQHEGSVELDYDSPDPYDDPVRLNKLIEERVDSLIQNTGEWGNFFKAKGKPQSVPVVLDQYHYVKSLFDKYVGTPVPFKSTKRHLITKAHITSALRISEEPERFTADCEETLRLLERYGPHGTVIEDDRVSEMINDKSSPGPNGKPIKRLLRLLRDIDMQYNENLQNSSRNSIRSILNPT